ncbi:MAG TPA: type II toxin-antitoxin system RelE/ParE family toxin [Bacteroides sp.]|nr:type II toxin-antitoxin system RelE/ParE family toxin [Bacteroides sp.]
MDISWTPRARPTYFKIIEYLGNDWSEREIRNFINEVDKLLDQIRQNPEMFEESGAKKMSEKVLLAVIIVCITGLGQEKRNCSCYFSGITGRIRPN